MNANAFNDSCSADFVSQLQRASDGLKPTAAVLFYMSYRRPLTNSNCFVYVLLVKLAVTILKHCIAMFNPLLSSEGSKPMSDRSVLVECEAELLPCIRSGLSVPRSSFIRAGMI